MNSAFSFDYRGGAFELFSAEHVFIIMCLAALILLLYSVRKILRLKAYNRLFRISLAFLLLLSEASLSLWYLLVGRWSVEYALPLHLCSFSLFLAVLMLARKSQWLFEFVYLAGLSGAFQAILTPDLGPYNFPHFVAFQFFIAHSAVVIACFFMIFVEGYRPRRKSIWNVLVILNVYALFVGLMNHITGGNYLFLAHKPENPSLMDFLGPWPWYIVSLEVVAVLMFILLYLPFSMNRLHMRKMRQAKPPGRAISK